MSDDLHIKEHIKSETEYILAMIKHILFLPLVFILFLFKLKTGKELFAFYHETVDFFKDAKITTILIILNAVIFYFQDRFIVAFISPNEFSLLSPSTYNLIGLHNFHTLITTNFLHADMMHLLGNMLFLFIFGRVVEKYYSTFQTILIYFIGCILSNVQSGIGASGAVSAFVMAAILIRPFYLSWGMFFFPMPICFIAFGSLIWDIFSIINYDPNSMVANLAHFFGYLTIFFILIFINRERREKIKKGVLVNIILLTIYFLVEYGIGISDVLGIL